LYCGDACAILPLIEAESVGLVFTSPPYNVGVAYDTVSDDLPLDEYLRFIDNVFTRCIDLLVPGGHIVINVANTSRQPYTPLSDYISTMLCKKITMKGEIIWDKQNITYRTAWGSWRSQNAPSLRDQHEYLLVFRKDGSREGEPDISRDEFVEFTRSIWRVSPESVRKHPAPFPVRLAKRVVKLYAFPGEVVLDPFIGSGTTAVACEQLGRRWIGIEISEKYCALSRDRIRAVADQLSLF